MENIGEDEEELWLAPHHLCDVSVTLVPPDNEEEKKKMIMHAPASSLTELPYFASFLADRWQALESTQTQLTTVTSPTDYVRVIRWSSSPANDRPPFVFQNLSDALCILQTAEHLLAHDCSEIAMAYLAAVSMTFEEEEAVRSAFLNAHIATPSEDLCARLGLRGGNPSANAVEALVSTTREILYSVIESTNVEGYCGEKCKRIIADSVGSESPSVIREAILQTLLQVWNKQTQELRDNGGDGKALYIWLWLTDLTLQHSNTKVVVQAIVTDYNFLIELIGHVSPPFNSKYAVIITTAFNDLGPRSTMEVRLTKLLRIITEVLVNGDVILHNKARCVWIEKWMHGSIKKRQRWKLIGVQESVNRITETLPLEDQGHIFSLFLQDEEYTVSLNDAYESWIEMVRLRAKITPPNPNSLVQ